MRAEVLIERQVDLLDRAVGDTYFRRQMMNGIVAQEAWDSAANVMAEAAANAYAYRVSADMSQLLIFAASQLDESDTWDHTLAPTAAGFVHFESPLPIYDTYGNLQKAHYMLWGPSQPDGTFLYFWNDMLEDPDAQALKVRATFHPDSVRAMGRWGSIGGPARTLDGTSLGPVEIDPDTYDVDLWDHLPDPRNRFSEDSHEWFGVKPNVGGRTVHGLPFTETAFGKVPITLRPVTNMGRYLHAFWLLLSQQVVETGQDHIKARTKRQSDRAGLPGTVTVVQLRRSPGNRSTGESKVEWSRRWVVRGHWRWQAYGVGRSERRRIWIDPFTKGPEDKPLVITSKVYDVR